MKVSIETPLNVAKRDMPAIIELLRQLYGSLEKEPDATQVVATAMGCRMVFARHETGIVGMARLVTVPRFGILGAWIEDVVVFQHMRRQGIGTALVRKLEEVASRLGVNSLQLLIFENDNIANRFWAHLGYPMRADRVIRRKMF